MDRGILSVKAPNSQRFSVTNGCFIYTADMDFSNFRDTGELSDISVVVEDKEFQLHKFPLYIKSDFFRALARSTASNQDRVELPEFPGGCETFEAVANYCYNMKVDIARDNVCKLRCAAEFLQMTSPGNLADISDRYLQDTLTSAKLGRSLGTIVDLLLQCAPLGAIAEQAKIVERCITGIVDCWLISSKFNKRISADRYHDTESMKKLAQFPLNWFLQLFIQARDKSVRPAILSDMVQIYITSAMEQHGVEVDEEKGKDEEEEKDSDADKDDQSGEDGQSVTPKEEKKVKSSKLDSIASLDEKQLSELAEVLDSLLVELPENAPLADNISPQWAIRMLQTAETVGCKSRGMLLKLAGKLLHRFSGEELLEVSPDLLCDIVQESTSDVQDGQPSTAICNVVDNYLNELAAKDKLTVEVFGKMAQAIPTDCRDNHDTLFQVLEKLLTSDEVKVTDEEKQELLDSVDFSKLNESTLQRAYEEELVPVSYITKASLALCTKLRKELDASKEIIETQEKQLERYGLGGRGFRGTDAEIAKAIIARSRADLESQSNKTKEKQKLAVPVASTQDVSISTSPKTQESYTKESLLDYGSDYGKEIVNPKYDMLRRPAGLSSSYTYEYDYQTPGDILERGRSPETLGGYSYDFSNHHGDKESSLDYSSEYYPRGRYSTGTSASDPRRWAYK